MSASSANPLRVAVLLGGDSAERQVSLRSGDAVATALAQSGHEISPIDPAGCDLAEVDWSQIDACFIALHGGAGEDGRIQAWLESHGVPYTGSGPETSRIAMSKSQTKRRFIAAGVPTPQFAMIAQHDLLDEIARRVAPLRFPLVIKPDCQGSSLGISVANSPEELPQAIDTARAYDALVVAESFVSGREFTVAVLDDRALPPLEIIAAEGLFSYEAKYQSSLTRYDFDFELPAEQREAIVRAAVAATGVLETRGLVRVDVMLDRAGHPWVLEVNTVPGMTARSLAPQAAERAGLSMADLCDLLIRRCLETAEVA